jgi:hypothetical protein
VEDQYQLLFPCILACLSCCSLRVRLTQRMCVLCSNTSCQFSTWQSSRAPRAWWDSPAWPAWHPGSFRGRRPRCRCALTCRPRQAHSAPEPEPGRCTALPTSTVAHLQGWRSLVLLTSGLWRLQLQRFAPNPTVRWQVGGPNTAPRAFEYGTKLSYNWTKGVLLRHQDIRSYAKPFEAKPLGVSGDVFLVGAMAVTRSCILGAARPRCAWAPARGASAACAWASRRRQARRLRRCGCAATAISRRRRCPHGCACTAGR